MSQLQSQSYPFDQNYTSAVFENGVQVFAKAQALGDIYLLSTANCYVLLLDDAAGPHAPSATRKGTIFPLPAGNYFFRSWHGVGQDKRNGLYAGAYSTAALAAAGGAPDAGNCLWIEANYRRGRLGTVAAADPAGFK